MRNGSWAVSRADGSSRDGSYPPPSPSLRGPSPSLRGVFGRSSSSVRDFRSEEPRVSPRLSKVPRELGRQYSAEPIQALYPTKRVVEKDEDVVTTRTYLSTSMTVKAPPSSIKSEAIRPRMAVPEPQIKRCQSQYMNHNNESQAWTEAMRLQVEYYNRPPSPPDSPRRGPAPPPRRRRAADSVKSLPLQSTEERMAAAPSIKTVHGSTSYAEAATSLLADMVAAKQAKVAQRSSTQPDLRLPGPSSQPAEQQERPALPSPAAQAAAEYRSKRRTLQPRNSTNLQVRKVYSRSEKGVDLSGGPPQSFRMLSSVESVTTRSTSTSKSASMRHVRRGTFGEDDMANLAGAREELIARLYADSSSSSYEPQSSRDSLASTSAGIRSSLSVESDNRRHRPWGYV